MTTYYSARGYITLADIDGFETRLKSMEETVKAIDTQVSGSSDLMYYGTGSSGNASPLSLTQTAIDAQRYPLNLKTVTFTHYFKAPFIEPPVVVATTDTSDATYACTVRQVTTTQVTIKAQYLAGTTTTAGEGLHVIAIGKTAA